MNTTPDLTSDNKNLVVQELISPRELVRRHIMDGSHVITEEDFRNIKITTAGVETQNQFYKTNREDMYSNEE